MKKEKIRLEDGRYLIYFSFKNDEKADCSDKAETKCNDKRRGGKK